MSPDAVKTRRWSWDRWIQVTLVLVGWALRLPPALDNRFHADEALYAYWGLLIGRGRDPWLATVPVYKPPLLPYLLAGTQALFGTSEFAVRMVGLAAGVVTVVLVAALCNTLYRHRALATGAAIAVALSPFAILFSATAFTDPVMVALGLGASVAAARGRHGWAGLLTGLSFATKQTGLVWVPLVIAIGLIEIQNPKAQIPKLQIPKPKSQTPSRPRPRSDIGHRTLDIGHWSLDIGHWSLVIGHWSFPLGFLLTLVPVFGWDTVRVAQGAESFWSLGITGYGGLRLIWPQELWARLRDWAEIGRYMFVSPVVNGALLVGLLMLTWRATRKYRYTRVGLTDLFLVTFVMIYFLLHWLWAFPVWDRYLLPLVPVLAILLGRTATLLPPLLRPIATRASPLDIGHWSLDIGHFSFVICHLSLVISLLLPALTAAQSRYPVGGDHGAYDGIDQVAAFLRAQPEGAVVYQHWLGWHYADYLFDAPVYLAYWPTPAWLAQDVRAFGARGPRYITFPSWESPSRVERALAGVGYALAPALTTVRRDGTRSFTVYSIQPLTNP